MTATDPIVEKLRRQHRRRVLWIKAGYALVTVGLWCALYADYRKNLALNDQQAVSLNELIGNLKREQQLLSISSDQRTFLQSSELSALQATDAALETKTTSFRSQTTFR